jgi:hypothetical protein
MVWEVGVEVTVILTPVSVAGWVAAAPSGEQLPFMEPLVYKKSYHFQSRTPFAGLYVSVARFKSGYVTQRSFRPDVVTLKGMCTL